MGSLAWGRGVLTAGVAPWPGAFFFRTFEKRCWDTRSSSPAGLSRHLSQLMARDRAWRKPNILTWQPCPYTALVGFRNLGLAFISDPPELAITVNLAENTGINAKMTQVLQNCSERWGEGGGGESHCNASTGHVFCSSVGDSSTYEALRCGISTLIPCVLFHSEASEVHGITGASAID